MARSRYKTIENGKTYFATSTVVNWLPLFALPDMAHIVLDATGDEKKPATDVL